MIDSASHEQEFRAEVQQIYLEKVAPAVQEIRERVESNAYLRRLVGEVFKEDLPRWLGAGVLALAVTPSNRIDDLIVASATAIQPAVKAGWRKHGETRKIRAHQYFFLYETERLLDV
jgi:hypothetical protein